MNYRDMGTFGNPLTGYNQEYYSAIIEQMRLNNKNNFKRIAYQNTENNYSSVKSKKLNYKVQEKNGD